MIRFKTRYGDFVPNMRYANMWIIYHYPISGSSQFDVAYLNSGYVCVGLMDLPPLGRVIKVERSGSWLVIFVHAYSIDSAKELIRLPRLLQVNVKELKHGLIRPESFSIMIT